MQESVGGRRDCVRTLRHRKLREILSWASGHWLYDWESDFFFVEAFTKLETDYIRTVPLKPQ